MLIAQITDLHIGFDRDNPHELNVRRLNLVIDQLNDLQPRPDLLVVTGDMVENGDDTDAYRHMVALVGRWQGPKLWVIGNHDDRTNLRAVLPQVPVDANGFIQYEQDFGGLRWIIIDTLNPGRHGGAFCELRAAWLSERLAERTGDPTIILLHHPPIDTGIEWMSAEPQEQWVQRLRAVIEPAPQIKAMFAGHVHRPLATSFAGKPMIVAPSTAPWVALDLDHVDPLHPDGRALIIADEPAFAVHRWDDGQMLTHFEIAGPRNVIAVYDSNLQPMMKAFLEERGTG